MRFRSQPTARGSRRRRRRRGLLGCDLLPPPLAILLLAAAVLGPRAAADSPGWRGDEEDDDEGAAWLECSQAIGAGAGADRLVQCAAALRLPSGDDRAAAAPQRAEACLAGDGRRRRCLVATFQWEDRRDGDGDTDGDRGHGEVREDPARGECAPDPAAPPLLAQPFRLSERGIGDYLPLPLPPDWTGGMQHLEVLLWQGRKLAERAADEVRRTREGKGTEPAPAPAPAPAGRSSADTVNGVPRGVPGDDLGRFVSHLAKLADLAVEEGTGHGRGSAAGGAFFEAALELYGLAERIVAGGDGVEEAIPGPWDLGTPVNIPWAGAGTDLGRPTLLGAKAGCLLQLAEIAHPLGIGSGGDGNVENDEGGDGLPTSLNRSLQFTRKALDLYGRATELLLPPPGEKKAPGTATVRVAAQAGTADASLRLGNTLVNAYERGFSDEALEAAGMGQRLEPPSPPADKGFDPFEADRRLHREARNLIGTAVRLYRPLAPGSDDDRTLLADALLSEGTVLTLLGDHALAIASWEDGLGIYSDVAEGGTYWDRDGLAFSIADVLHNLSEAYLVEARYEEASDHYSRAMRGYDALPDAMAPQWGGMGLTRVGDDGTIDLHLKALKQYYESVGMGDTNLDPFDTPLYEPDEVYEGELLAAVGSAYLVRNEAHEAAQYLTKAIRLYEDVGLDGDGVGEEALFLADALLHYAHALYSMGEYLDSASFFDLATHTYSTASPGKNPFHTDENTIDILTYESALRNMTNVGGIGQI